FPDRYRPIPVDPFSSLPLYPVNPFSNIRGRSSLRMPFPVSSITNVPESGPERKIRTPPVLVYFKALDRHCPITNPSHLGSVSTCFPVFSKESVSFFSIKTGAYL